MHAVIIRVMLEAQPTKHERVRVIVMMAVNTPRRPTHFARTTRDATCPYGMLGLRSRNVSELTIGHFQL